MDVVEKKINLVILLGSLGGGGAERCMLNLAKALDKSTYSISIIISKKIIEYNVDCLGDVNIISLDSAKTVFCGFKLRKVLKKIHPDLVLSATYMMSVVASFFLPKKLPFIVRESCIVSKRSRNKTEEILQRIFYIKINSRAKRIICQSVAMQKDIIRHLKLNPEKTQLIPNLVDTAFLEKYESQECFGDELKLIFVGRLHFEKGLDLLFRAIKLCKRKLTLTVLGQGPDEDELKSLADSLGLREKIFWGGFQPEPYKLMVNCDVLMLPSRTEGFPNIVLEASCLGMPTIAFSAAGGTCDVIKEGVNGRLVKFSTEDLADAVEIFDKNIFDVANVKNYARSNFSFSNVSEVYSSLFKLSVEV
jgi:glycosyltransferase involved in cell wall biosynthesis